MPAHLSFSWSVLEIQWSSTVLEAAQVIKKGNSCTRITSQTKKGEGRNNVRGALKSSESWLAEQKLLATCSSFLSHDLLSEDTKNGHAFPSARGSQIKARHSPPDLVVWPGPCWAPGCYQPEGWYEQSLICPSAESAGAAQATDPGVVS